MILKDKQDMHILTSTHRPPAEGNFCDEHWKPQNHSLLKTTLGTWAMTQGTEWLTAIQLIREHGSGQNYSFASWTQLH
jgi:hypothetical protein